MKRVQPSIQYYRRAHIKAEKKKSFNLVYLNNLQNKERMD